MTSKTVIKNSLPIKSVTSQDLFQLQETLIQLQSWEKMLTTFGTFSTTTSPPLNKKKNIRDYYANSQVFQLFLQDFFKQTSTLEKQISDLQIRKK
ncbi:hypothetical protein ACWN8P_02090 [Vagococcus salmoninarum]|uniref:Uncharacterized protein n=1 Tax=Vagococcus salmoninarum TaxID=2739 RepID=A0A429ZUW1_9ENTE|nr:hypothetical protein [Vagococcus salmoninarum]RST97536.1 hypothetical protein CBF35_02390 [Vagococcus salmoninarum]